MKQSWTLTIRTDSHETRACTLDELIAALHGELLGDHVDFIQILNVREIIDAPDWDRSREILGRQRKE